MKILKWKSIFFKKYKLNAWAQQQNGEERGKNQ